MGASGTDVAREAADIVLLNDSFESIVKAVESGRAIYENIRKFIVYVFSHNWAELIPYVLYAVLANSVASACSPSFSYRLSHRRHS